MLIRRPKTSYMSNDFLTKEKESEVSKKASIN